MTRAEMNATVNSIADENIQLKSTNARLRAELGRVTAKYNDLRQTSERLREMLISAQKKLHQKHGTFQMSECAHPDCIAASRER